MKIIEEEKLDKDELLECVAKAIKNGNVILVSNGQVFIHGSEPIVLANMTSLMKAFLTQDIEPEQIENCLELAQLSGDELEKRALEKMQSMSEMLKKMISETEEEKES